MSYFKFMSYGIGQVISASVNKNGKPLPHLGNRMLKAKELRSNNTIQRILIGNRIRSLVDDMERYLANELGMFHADIYTLYGGYGTAGELFHGRERVKQMLSEHLTPADICFYVITTDWASERTKFISDWILDICKHEVVGVPDGRMEWIKDKTERMLGTGEITEERAKRWTETVSRHVELDLYFEPMKLRMYKRIISRHPRPPEDGRELDNLERFSVVRYPPLFIACAREFSKGLTGKAIYRTSESVYS